MAAGARLALVHQAALVWGLGEIDVEPFVRWGEIDKAPTKRARMSPELRAAVDRQIDQIMADGRLIVPPLPPQLSPANHV